MYSGVRLAHPSLRSLVPQDLKKQGALGPIVSSDALVFPGEHLQVWRRLQTLHLALRVPARPDGAPHCACFPAKPPLAKQLATCKSRLKQTKGNLDWAKIWGSTLQGLHDVALHMRTTILSSALSNSPFSSAGECTCICTTCFLGPHIQGLCNHIENGGRCRFGQPCNTKLTTFRFA